MKDDIFKTARECISKGLIERMFYSQKAKWEKNEYWTLSPIRNDKTIGSFHISDKGQYFDHATSEGGDLIDLVCKKHSFTQRQAAEYIIHTAGGVLPEEKKKNKKQKLPPVLPIPEDALPKLNAYLNTKWMVDNIGPVVSGWEYRNQQGELQFCVARHEKDGKKAIKPYYWSGKRWEHGNPLKDKFPLYGITRDLSLPILIVEGEKCADIKVDGYTLLTWCGGTNQWDKSDWTILDDKKVIIWPDNDGPGITAAININSILKNTKILDIKNKPKTWDIADAYKEGIDLVKFIEECGEYDTIEELQNKILENENGFMLDDIEIPISENEIITGGNETCKTIHKGPFRFMGFDESGHYFLTKGSRTIKRIGQGSFSKSKLLELAPLSYWCMKYSQRKGYDFESAVDDIIRQSESVGFFRPDSVRGTGVWIDEKCIIVNNGDHCVNGTGKPIKDFQSNFFYIQSERKMGTLDGKIATDEQGKSLIGLFTSQGFETKTESWIACGWALLAPFAGILNWRPHVWITGPTQCGKTFLLRELIHPICGPIAETGTGKTSAPGVYRSLKSSAAPIILDEMEPGKNKDTRLRIEEKLEIARNASSDFSSNMALANKSGGVDRFCIRSPFCFSSVIPYFPGEAIENRILICRLKGFSKVKNKRERTSEIISTGIMDDPGIFRRRIYHNIKTIIKNTEVIKKIIYAETFDNRKADNLSALFAALFIMADEKELEETEDLKKIIIEILEDVKIEKHESDEDKLLRYIFDYQARMISGENKSLAEIILDCHSGTTDLETNNILRRHGMRIYEPVGDENKYLAIAKHHETLNHVLEKTQYQGRYIDILKRHPASVEQTPSIRFAGQTKSAILLEWSQLENVYFSEDFDNENDTMEIPF